MYEVLLLSKTKVQNCVLLILQTRWCKKMQVCNEKIMTQLCSPAPNRNPTPARQLDLAQWDT